MLREAISVRKKHFDEDFLPDCWMASSAKYNPMHLNQYANEAEMYSCCLPQEGAEILDHETNKSFTYWERERDIGKKNLYISAVKTALLHLPLHGLKSQYHNYFTKQNLN